MNTLLIEFTKPNPKSHTFPPILSWLIRLFQWTPKDGIPKFSHVRWRWFSSRFQEDLVYEASGSALKFVGSLVWPKYVEIVEVYEVDVTNEEKIAIIKWCIKHAGLKYARLGLIGLLYVILMKAIFRMRVKNPFKDGEYTQVCVEAIIRGLILVGIKTDIDPDSADLLDARNLLRQYAQSDEPRIRRLQ